VPLPGRWIGTDGGGGVHGSKLGFGVLGDSLPAV
jgi:hypothetical protein